MQTFLSSRCTTKPLQRKANGLSSQRSSRAPVRVIALLDNDNGSKAPKGSSRLPLSMFTPYNQLPPEGEVAHPEDASCDPTVQKCKTLIYTYESKCTSCSGTGFVKSNANGRRASLCTCLRCHGLGYVRHTTARYVPDADHPEGVYSMGRPDADSGSGAAAGNGAPRK